MSSGSQSFNPILSHPQAYIGSREMLVVTDYVLPLSFPSTALSEVYTYCHNGVDRSHLNGLVKQC